MVLWQKRRYGRETPVPMEEGSLLDADMLMSEFTDTLFSTLSSHQLVSWPNPREIGICWLLAVLILQWESLGEILFVAFLVLLETLCLTLMID